jgi:hypothetical protein
MRLLPRPVIKQGRPYGRAVDKSVCGATRSMRNKRAWINAIKLFNGCEAVGCDWTGDFSPEQLAFDHKNPAKKNERLRGNIRLFALSWDDLETELKKCRVVCHNCHSRHTILSGHHRLKYK